MFPVYIDDSVQNCSNSIANALELLQSCTKSSIYLNSSMPMVPLVSRDSMYFRPQACIWPSSVLLNIKP